MSTRSVRPALAALLALSLFAAADTAEPLPAGAVARFGTLRVRPYGDAVLSPDGKVLYTSSSVPGTRARDAATGKELWAFGWEPGHATTLALSPDGKALALGGGGLPVRVWDLEKKRERCRCEVPPFFILGLAFSTDGAFLAGTCPDDTVRIWDAATGKEKRRIEKQTRCRFVAFSADGKALTVLDQDGVARVFGVADGKELRRTTLGDGRRGFVAWPAPRGERFLGTAAGDRTVRLWDEKGKEVRAFAEGPVPPLTAAALSADGKWAVTASFRDRTLRLWDAETGDLVRGLPDSGVAIIAGLAFGAGGKTVMSLSADGSIRRWDTATGAALGPPEGQLRGGQQLALSRDGKWLATAGNDGVVVVWDAATAKERRRIAACSGRFGMEVALSADGKLLATHGMSEAVRLWDMATGKERPLASEKMDGIVRPTFSADGKMLAVSGRTPRLWQTETGKERVRLRIEIVAFSATFAPDGKSLITLDSDGKARVWNTDSGRERQAFDTPGALEAALSPDGKRLGLRMAGPYVAVLDLETGDHTARWAVLPRPSRIGFTNTGRLVTGTYFGPRLWNAEKGEEVSPPPGHGGPVMAGAFRDGGREAVTVGADRMLRGWAADTGKELRKVDRLPGPLGSIVHAAFTTDGGLVALSGSQPPAAYLYDLKAGKPGRSIAVKGAITHLTLAPDGKHLALTTFDLRGRSQSIFDTATGEERMALKDGTVCAFAPGGTVAVSVQEPGNALRFLSLPAKRAYATAKGSPALQVRVLAFSPDGAMVAAGGSGGIVRVFETATGGERFRLRVSPAPLPEPSALAFSPGGRLLAVGSTEGDVVVWAAAPPAGKVPAFGPVGAPLVREVSRLRGHTGAVHSIAFAPSGRSLLTTSADATALVWGVGDEKRPAPPKLSAADMAGLWDALASEDAAAAFRAVVRLADAPAQAVPLLRERLGKRPATDDKEVLRHVARLSNPDYQEEATAALWKMGRRVRPALREVLDGKPSIALREKAQALLDRLDAQVPPEDLRGQRAVEALERIGGPVAREALLAVAKGGDPELASLARAALARTAR